MEWYKVPVSKSELSDGRKGDADLVQVGSGSFNDYIDEWLPPEDQVKPPPGRYVSLAEETIKRWDENASRLSSLPRNPTGGIPTPFVGPVLPHEGVQRLLDAARRVSESGESKPEPGSTT